jgi:hypothetical protein
MIRQTKYVLSFEHSFKIRSSPPGGLTRDPVDSGPEPGRVEEKTRKEKF